MKGRKITLTITLLFVMLYIILLLNPFKITTKTPSSTSNSFETNNLTRDFSNLKAPDEPPWWNLTYHYRKPIIITEPGAISRTNEPVEVTLTFDAGKAHKNSIRLMYYNGTSWIGPLPVQVKILETYPDPNYIKTANIAFLANVSKSGTETYYIYYTDYSVETISYSTDIFVNTSLISNSYFTWWIDPPTIFKYPNSGADWNRIDNGWAGYPEDTLWRGADLNSPYVTLTYSNVEEEGPIYAKVLYKYEVQVSKTSPPKPQPLNNSYVVTFTVYARNPFVRVDLEIISSDTDVYRGVWGTVMDVGGDVDDDKYAFFTSGGVTTGIVQPESVHVATESSLDAYNGWTWAALYDTEPGEHGVGVIVHKDYTPEYYPLYVARNVRSDYSPTAVYNYTFIFACIEGTTLPFSGRYYYRFFDVPSDGNAWDPVDETARVIGFPLNISVDVEQEAYYLFDITVVDMLSRGVENASIAVYDLDTSELLNTSLTSSSGETIIKFYYNRTFTAIIEANYTTGEGIYVEKNATVSLDLTDVRNPILLTITLDLADLYIYVQNLDEKRIVGANVTISYLSYEFSGVTDSQGVVFFYRILGQVTWSINVTYTASFDFILINDTESLLVDEGSEEVFITLQMSDLRITAVDLLDEVVDEYTVFLYRGTEPSGTPLDYKTTGNGVVVFEDIPVGNFTLTFKYLARVEYGDKLSPTVVNVKYPSNRNIVVSLPLATMHVVAVDVNNISIPDATIQISNKSEEIGEEPIIAHYGISDESGMVNFTRILFNITWDIRVELETFEGKGVTIEVTLYDVRLDKPEKYVYVQLPVTDMVIHVLTEEQRSMDEYWKYGVGGAVVYANITGEMVLITNATDSAGYAIARFIPIGRYNVTVYFLEQNWWWIFDVYNNSALQCILPFKYSTITTMLNVTYPAAPYIDVVWTENITVELTFYVVETGTLISYARINWSLIDLQGNVALSGYGKFREEKEDYVILFNSSEVTAGRYTLEIYGLKATYPPPTTKVTLLVNILEVPTELVPEKESIKTPVGSPYVTVRVFYNDTFHNRGIANANVTLTLEGKTYQMVSEEDNPGWYKLDLPVSELDMGVYALEICADKTNYELAEKTVSLRITEPVIKIVIPIIGLVIVIPRSLFIASIVGIVVPVTGIAGFSLYRYFKIPKVLRVLNKIIENIEKGEKVSIDAIASVRSRTDIISEKVGRWWKSVGVEFSGVKEEGEEFG